MSEEQPGSLAAVPTAAVPDPEVGQIWIARPDRGPDMYVLVIEVHPGHVQVLLCGEECHLATETDAVLAPSTTGCLRRMVVHGDVSAAVLSRRLVRRLGRIDPHLVERIARRGRGLDFASSDLGRGTAILSEADPRWDWKLDKHRQLRTLRARAGELGWEIYKLGPREE